MRRGALHLALTVAIAAGCGEAVDAPDARPPSADARAAEDANLDGHDAGAPHASDADAGDDAAQTLADAEPQDALSSDGSVDTGPRCPTVGAAEVVGHIADDDLAELSGLVASRRQSDVLWAHADDRAVLYAVDRATLAVRGRYTLVAGGERGPAGDVEDVALGDGALYLGDIGSGHAGAVLHIYRVIEPVVPAASVAMDVAADVMEVDPATLDDAEALLLDPIDGHLVIVEKDGRPHVCDVGPFVAGPASQHDCATRLDGFANPSAADVSADGRWVVVRREDAAILLPRPLGRPLLAAFAEAPCAFGTLATPANSDECNGEAIAFAADGRAIYSASERTSAGGEECPGTSVHRYPLGE